MDNNQEPLVTVLKFHTLTYGKLMTGSDPYGKIVPKFEHRVTGKTDGFPEFLEEKCALESLVPGWAGVMIDVLPNWKDIGALIVRTFKDQGKVWLVFCRILPWPENGHKLSSRQFVHAVSWCIEYKPYLVFCIPFIIRQMFSPESEIAKGNRELPVLQNNLSRLSETKLEITIQDNVDHILRKTWLEIKRDYKEEFQNMVEDGEIEKESELDDDPRRLDLIPALQSYLILASEFDLKSDQLTLAELDIYPNFSIGLHEIQSDSKSPFSIQYFGNGRKTLYTQRSDSS